MSIKLLSLFFIVYLSSTYCSDCMDKTSFEENEDKYNACYRLSTNSYNCHYNSDNDHCEELYCNKASSDYCENIPDSPEGKRCLPKSDDSGCEYKSCTDLTSNCNEFNTSDEDKICTFNPTTRKCEIKLCSEGLKENCGELKPYYPDQKCAFNADENKCKITFKECEELDSDKCDWYYSKSEDDANKKCILDSSNGKCKKFECSELPKTECSKFKPNNNEEVCTPYENNCKLLTCSQLPVDTCETIEFSNPGIKCVKSGKSCTISKCEEMSTSDCGKFTPVDKTYKCYYSSNANQCTYKHKNCEEFSKGECNLFNIEDNLEDTNGKKCVEDDGKCVLNSKKLEFSAFIILILFLLF